MILSHPIQEEGIYSPFSQAHFYVCHSVLKFPTCEFCIFGVHFIPQYLIFVDNINGVFLYHYISNLFVYMKTVVLIH